MLRLALTRAGVARPGSGLVVRGLSNGASGSELRRVLESVATGSTTAREAELLLHTASGSADEVLQDFARIDHGRANRTGVPEVIFGEGKTTEQLATIFCSMTRNAASPAAAAGDEGGGGNEGDKAVLATRVSGGAFEQLQQRLEELAAQPQPLRRRRGESWLTATVAAGDAAAAAATLAQLRYYTEARIAALDPPGAAASVPCGRITVVSAGRSAGRSVLSLTK